MFLYDCCVYISIPSLYLHRQTANQHVPRSSKHNRTFEPSGSESRNGWMDVTTFKKLDTLQRSEVLPAHVAAILLFSKH